MPFDSIVVRFSPPGGIGFTPGVERAVLGNPRDRRFPRNELVYNRVSTITFSTSSLSPPTFVSCPIPCTNGRANWPIGFRLIAADEGFHRLRFSRLRSERRVPISLQWIDNGYARTELFAIDRRLRHPEGVLLGQRTVVVPRVSYAAPNPRRRRSNKHAFPQANARSQRGPDRVPR